MSITGSLATDTGPGARGWSTLDQQMAHVGEKVEFSFVLARSLTAPAPIDPSGVADYGLITVGETTYEAELNADGHFRLTCALTGFRDRQRVPVRAAAYRQRGSRDRMKIGDAWVTNSDPDDQSDFVIADDDVELLIYQSHVDLPVKHPGTDLMMSSGTLEIGPPKRSVAIPSRERASRGFDYSGPDDAGLYHVTFDPQADELEKSGDTPIRFTAPDAEGRTHVTAAFVYSP